jgi:C-methyltransferase-like protein
LLKARAGQPVDTVIDINPSKQGRFLPATGLVVKSPEKALGELPEGSTIFVMNSNYLEEIKQMSGNQFHCIGVDHE